MLVATIVRDKNNGRIYIRIGDAPQPNGNVKVVEVLQGTDRTELKKLAERFVKNSLGETVTP